MRRSSRPSGSRLVSGFAFGKPTMVELVHERLRDPIVLSDLPVGQPLDCDGLDQQLIFAHRSRCRETSPLLLLHRSRCPETCVHDVLKPDTTVSAERKDRSFERSSLVWGAVLLVCGDGVAADRAGPPLGSQPHRDRPTVLLDLPRCGCGPVGESNPTVSAEKNGRRQGGHFAFRARLRSRVRCSPAPPSCASPSCWCRYGART